MQISRRHHLLQWLGAALPLAGCRSTPKPEINAGAKSGAGQLLLAEAISIHLESIHGPGSVTLRPPLGGTAMTHETLLARQIDLYPEYSGVALTAILGLASASDPAQVREQVIANYRSRYRCEWVAPLGFANPPVILTTRERAAQDNLSSLSSAEARKGSWRLGTTREFVSRSDGLPFLLGTYKLILSGGVQVLETSQLYSALSSGQVTLVAGEALDAGAQDPAFLSLADDRHAFPPHDAGIVVSLDALDRLPSLLASLNQLEGKFPFDRVARIAASLERQQDAARDDDKAPPVLVRDFALSLLREAGLNPPQ
jgi:osmoprotectant transport system substrate-binding protein